MPATATSSVFPKLSEVLGLFGGTFDPIHYGHLRLAEEAISHLGLSSVRWIPAGQPPHRGTPQVTPQHRLEMVLRSTAKNPHFSVDPAEVLAERASYTVETLERLRSELGTTKPLARPFCPCAHCNFASPRFSGRTIQPAARAGHRVFRPLPAGCHLSWQSSCRQHCHLCDDATRDLGHTNSQIVGER